MARRRQSGSRAKRCNRYRMVLQIIGPPSQVDQVIRLLAGDGWIPWGDLELSLFDAMASARHSDYLGIVGTKIDGKRISRDDISELYHQLDGAMLGLLEATRKAARTRPNRQPLDFRGIIPIPSNVLWSGWRNGGRKWCIDHWGCRPLTEAASLEIGTERINTRPDLLLRGTRKRARKGSIVRRRKATFGFECEGGKPWPIVKAIQKAWPDLAVTLRDDWIDDDVDEWGREVA